MVEDLNKLEAAFIAGCLDAMAEGREHVPEHLEHLLRMVLSESDCAALARLSKVLFQQHAAGLRLLSPASLIGGTRNGGTNGHS